MIEQAVQKTEAPAATLPEAVEQALVNGNLADLSASQRVVLYQQTCDSLGLNSLTAPFAYITLNNKLVLYATRNCTDQLRKLHNVDVTITSRERMDDVYVVTARAKLPNGRTDEEIGAVALGNARGEALANVMMKASTKAKRRVTLSIVGLSLLDETEVETIPGARVFTDAAPLPSAPALPPVDYREPSEDEWSVFEDKVREQTGYSPAEVCTLLGQSPSEHLRALHAAGRPKTGKALLADLIAHKREGRAIPGVSAPPAVPTVPDDGYGCAVCGELLKEARFRDGTHWSPADLADWSTRKHGKPLCMTHYREFNAAKLGQQRETVEV